MFKSVLLTNLDRSRLLHIGHVCSRVFMERDKVDIYKNAKRTRLISAADPGKGPPTFSFSLFFSCSIFQIWGHDNYSELNTLENTDTETISAFRLLSCLCFTRRGWLCDFRSK